MKTPLLLLALLCLFSNQIQAQAWQAYEPALPEPVGVYDLRIAEGDENVAAAVAMKYAVTANNYDWQPMDQLIFVKTSDGGNTWQSGAIPMGVEPYASNICPVNNDLLWASGLDIDFASWVVRTTDGGQSWERFLEDGFFRATSYVNFVHFWDEQNGIAVGDPAPSPTDPTPFYEIYTTSNGGQNWTRVPSANIPPQQLSEFGVAGRYFVVGDTVWFSTINSANFKGLRLFRSADRGLHWTASASPAVEWFSFADGLYGIGAEHVNSNAVNLRLTTDGGDSWTDLPPLQMGRISSLAMVPGSRYILATMRTSNIAPPFKTILSTDLGQSWQEIGDGSELACNAQFASPTVGYAGEWQPANHPTRMYKYADNPLSGLLSGKPLDAEVAVSPNPASDFAWVEVKTAQPFDFLLLLSDTQGRLLKLQVFPKTDSFSASLDLQALPSGLYTLTVSTREGAVVRKVLKQ
ncbi:MAG: T9SS type A sorting domain-containing protein [Lewinellaceae bacterium]|nr:T9SS type A sorting domain-containing protein [Lewinellaceae bacterium]